MLDAVAHFYCYVKYSVLTMQLSHHYTCKTKHHFHTQLYWPHMNENSYTKVTTIHIVANLAKCEQFSLSRKTEMQNGSNHEFHPDTEKVAF